MHEFQVEIIQPINTTYPFCKKQFYSDQSSNHGKDNTQIKQDNRNFTWFRSFRWPLSRRNRMWTLLLDNWRFVGGINYLWGPLIPIFKAKFYPSKHCHFEIPIAFQKKAGRRCKLYGRLGSMLDSMLYNDCNMQSVRFKNSKRVQTGYFIGLKVKLIV